MPNYNVQLSQTSYNIRLNQAKTNLNIVSSGLQGPPGPPGESAATYIHTQSTPSSIWTINHNLGFKPSVELLDSGGNEFDADVLHTSNNQVIVYLNTEIAGIARLV